MDFKLLEYIVAIEDYGNISNAAKAMFISQSGLNQRLINLEEELGTQLFFRTKRNMHPTEAGKVYLKNAREILRIRDNTYATIEDLNNNVTGTLSYGLSWEHGVDMFTEIFPQFNIMYPGITMNLVSRSVKEHQEALLSGDLDIAFVMQTEQDKTDLNYIHLANEDFLLGIPRSHPLAQKYAAPPGHPLTTIDIKLVKDETFSFMFTESTQRRLIDQIFESEGIEPKILCETGLNHALSKIVQSGLSCTIIPRSYAINDESSAWFYLEQRPKWEWNIAYAKNHYLRKPEKYLIELARQYALERERLWDDPETFYN